MESYNDVTLPEYGNDTINSSIRITVEVLGITYKTEYQLGTDPGYVGKAVENTVRKAPKTIRWE